MSSSAAPRKGKTAEGVLASNGVQMDKDELEGARNLWDSIQFSKDPPKR